MKVNRWAWLLVPFLISSCARWNPFQRQADRLTSLEQLWTLSASYPPRMQWLNDTQLLVIQDNCLQVYQPEFFLYDTTLFCLDSPWTGHIWKVKPLPQGWLLGIDLKHLYRHSRLGKFIVVDTLRDTIYYLDEDWIRDPIPDPMGRYIAYHKRNNVWLRDLKTDSTWQVTNYPDTGTAIIAGVPDWVYEEEFSLVHAMAWSDDGQQLAYYVFDQHAVPEYQIVRYHRPYPQWYRYRYPRAGFPPATVQIAVYEPATGRTWIAPVRGDSSGYIPQIAWRPRTHDLAIVHLDRQQRRLRFYLWQPGQRGATVLFEERPLDSAFIRYRRDWFFRGPDTLVWLSERTGWWNLYEFILPSHQWRPVTNWQRRIERLYGYYPALGGYVLTCNDPLRAPNDYAPFVVGDMVRLLGYRRRDWHGTTRLRLSPSGQYYIRIRSALDLPPVWQIFSADNPVHEVATIEDNSWLRFQVGSYDLPVPQKWRLRLDDQHEVEGWALIPKRPRALLLFVYGGPGVQVATNQWMGFRGLWFRFLASQGIAVVWIDNHGANGYGRAFATSIYRRLGTLEVADQARAARYWQQRLRIRPEKTAVWGWSYGGYLSGLLWLRRPDVFRYAVSVAPVSDWHFYDNIYTERYMDLPALNPDGYQQAAWHATIDSLPQQGAWLILHGDYDDNVHVQHLYDFLLKARRHLGPHIQWQVYPNAAHGLGPFYWDVYRRLHHFLVQHLLGRQ